MESGRGLMCGGCREVGTGVGRVGARRKRAFDLRQSGEDQHQKVRQQTRPHKAVGCFSGPISPMLAALMGA